MFHFAVFLALRRQLRRIIGAVVIYTRFVHAVDIAFVVDFDVAEQPAVQTGQQFVAHILSAVQLGVQIHQFIDKILVDAAVRFHQRIMRVFHQFFFVFEMRMRAGNQIEQHNAHAFFIAGFVGLVKFVDVEHKLLMLLVDVVKTRVQIGRPLDEFHVLFSCAMN